jgi:hypothetical protein
MLRGSLEHFGLVLIALLSAELKTTSWLRLTRGRLSAEFAIQDDRVIWAAFGDERGQPALDAVALGLAEAEFQLEQGPAPREQNLNLTVGELRAHLLSLGAPVMRLDAVPVTAGAGDASLDHTADAVFCRSSLEMLLAVDGRRTVRDIIGARPLVPALLELRGLVDTGLIRLQPMAADTSSNGAGPTSHNLQASVVPARQVVAEAPKRPPFVARWHSSAGRLTAALGGLTTTRARVGLAMLLAVVAATAPFIPGVSPHLTDLLAAGQPAPEIIVVRPTSRVAPTAVPPVQQPTSTAAIGSASEFTLETQPVAAQPPKPELPLIDMRFTTQPQGWLIKPPFATWSDGAYRLAATAGPHFVAVQAPLQPASENVMIHATFRKTGGPPGGGYGIIVRHQNGEPLDGSFQGGHYYVLEAADGGEVGVWRRDDDRWVDLLSWTHSDAVQTGNTSNQLSVQTIGTTLVFLVNGIEVTRQTDTALPSGGGVGIFVGGDGNEVAVDRFSLGPDR